MVERRADCVIVSLLQRFCKKSNYQHRQLGIIAIYTLASFYIDAPSRLLRNFIEESGVSLLWAAVKFLIVDAVANDSGTVVSAMYLFKIIWGLVVNTTCSPDFSAILSSSPSISPLARDFRVVDSNSGDSDHLTKQRFTNQELLPVCGLYIYNHHEHTECIELF